MRNAVVLLVSLVGLFLLASLVLQLVYGPSYPFLSGEDCWFPDGHGGWVEHGRPSGPKPAEPSVEVPLFVQYLPIFLPAVVLALFLFTPLSRHIERRPPQPPPDQGDAPADSAPSA